MARGLGPAALHLGLRLFFQVNKKREREREQKKSQKIQWKSDKTQKEGPWLRLARSRQTKAKKN